MLSEKSFDISLNPSKIFISDNPIKSKSYCRVFIDLVGEGTWNIVNDSLYDVINDTIVFIDIPVGKYLAMQVATTPSEFTQSPTENTRVLSIKNEIKTVADNIQEIINASDKLAEVAIVSSHIDAINTVSSHINAVNTVSDNIINVDKVGDNITNVNIVGDNIANVNIVGNNISDVNTVVNNIIDIQNADENATLAINAKNLAEKWANEQEDVEVTIGKYSAYHWAMKAEDLVTTGVIDDTAESIIRTYSSVKINDLLDAITDSPLNVITLDSISDLLAYNGTGLVYVKNYHLSLTGGGDYFFYNANGLKSTHNGGTVIDATAPYPTDWTNSTLLNNWFNSSNSGTGVWERQFSGIANVKYFGAKGIGSGVDHVQIQKALDCYTTIFIPNGLYIINESIKNIRKSTISNYFNRPPYSVKPQEIGVRIIGESIEGTVLVEGSKFTGDSVILLDGDYDNTSTPSIPTRQFNNHVENLTIKGRSPALSNAKGIKLKAIHTAKFSNIICTQLKYGVFINGSEVIGSVDANNSEFLSFEKCEFSENKIAGYSGIQTRQGTVSFTDCDVVRNFGDGILMSVAGLNINGGNISSNGRDGGNFVGLNVSSAVRPSQNRAVSIVGTMFENNNLAHIRLIDVAGYKISSTTHQPYTNYGATELSILLIGGGTFENSGGSFKENRIEAYGESATAPLSIIKATSTAVAHKGLFEEGTSLHSSLVYTPTLNLGASFKLSSKTLKPKVLTNVLASRSVGTVYTNTSIDDLNLQIAGYAIGASQYLTITIDGKVVGLIGNGGSATGTEYFLIDKIVPAGKTYQISISAGTPVVTHWHEY